MARDWHRTGNSDFDWRDFITLDVKDPTTLRYIEGSLDQIASTSEGQRTIREAYDNQNRLFKERDWGSNPDENGLVRPIISDDSTIANKNTHKPTLGIIVINVQQIQQYEYLGIDDKRYDLSFQLAVYHELCHTKYEEDPTISKLPEKLRHSYQEEFVNRETSLFMQKYYGEVLRDGHKGYKEKPGEELITTQENLGADHYYDEMLPTPQTPSTASADFSRAPTKD